MGLDVWGGCVTEHTEEVQEVLKAQAVSVWGCGEDPADSLLEGVSLSKKAFCECHTRSSPNHTFKRHRESGGSGSASWENHHHFGASMEVRRTHDPTGEETGMAFWASELNLKAGLGAEKEGRGRHSKQREQDELVILKHKY